MGQITAWLRTRKEMLLIVAISKRIFNKEAHEHLGMLNAVANAYVKYIHAGCQFMEALRNLQQKGRDAVARMSQPQSDDSLMLLKNSMVKCSQQMREVRAAQAAAQNMDSLGPVLGDADSEPVTMMLDSFVEEVFGVQSCETFQDCVAFKAAALQRALQDAAAQFMDAGKQFQSMGEKDCKANLPASASLQDLIDASAALISTVDVKQFRALAEKCQEVSGLIHCCVHLVGCHGLARLA